MNPPPLPEAASNIILTTGDRIEGALVTRNLGIVRGNSVRALGTKGSFKFVGGGGEVPTMTELHDTTQREAERNMVLRAAELGADAVTVVRYQVTSPSGALYSVMCYGTAVTLSDSDKSNG